MSRLMLVLSLLALAVLACNFSAGPDGDANESTPVPTRQTGSVPTATPFATLTPTAQPTSTPAPTATTGVVATPCTTRTDWPLYTVVAGDTLAKIARRVGTTTAALSDANCLDNPDLLEVGQALHVPQLPPPPTITPVPTAARASFRYPPRPDHYFLVADTAVITSPAVRLTAGVDNAQVVQFFARKNGSGASMYLGEDRYLADGANIYYTFSEAGRYELYAVTQSGVQSDSFLLTYDPDYEEPPPRLDSFPLVDPYLAHEGHYTLEGGSTVNLTWPGVPQQAVKIEFVLTPTGTGTGDAAEVIATDNAPFDGVAATWDVPERIWAHLQAIAYLPDGSKVSSGIINVYAEG